VHSIDTLSRRGNDAAWLVSRFARFADLLADGADADDAFARLRAAESIGRPLGNDRFLADLERLTARQLRLGKRGPKPAGKTGN
jgi:putative transposase